ncbi:hypothetical protein ACRN98_22005 [Shewanella oncorhynchi]|uniref:hypothetical protein n=1 Tax=Shewanella TaxID=22 RepID=UPI0021DA4CF6|nr:hypothetical protein [Shewanella sp. SM69]MCU8036937.1 hypothetical protein [Shewanella sp. SM69]
MIPETGWLVIDGIQSATPYATYGLYKPSVSLDTPFELELGPIELNNSGGSIKEFWWLFNFNGTSVTASRYNHFANEFDDQQIIFYVDNVKRLSATFDQLGRPMVFYETVLGELRLYWFDPVNVENTTTVFGDGSYPFSTFDIRWDTSNARSDNMLFYIRDGGIYYRLQRDRYSIEHATPVINGAILLEADMTVDYRLQLLYRYIDTGYNPPPPVPPVVDPASGAFAYLMTGYQSAIEIVEPDIISATTPFSIAFQLDNVEALNAKSTLFSYGNLKQMPKVALTFSGAERDNIELSFFGYYFTRKIFFGLQSGHWLIEFYTLSGIGPIDSMRVSCKPKGSDTYQVYSMEGVIKPTNTAKGQVLRIGSRPSYGERVYQMPGDVGSGFVPDSEYAFGLRAAISNIEVHSAIVATPVIKIPMTKAQGEAQTLLDAADAPIALSAAHIKDYRAANWVFIEG